MAEHFPDGTRITAPPLIPFRLRVLLVLVALLGLVGAVGLLTAPAWKPAYHQWRSRDYTQSAQNAAAAEQVSATTQEQNAAVEEMTSSAEELARMAADLQEVVSRFQVSGSSGEGSRLQDVSAEVTAVTRKRRKAA
mgnify:CR=1 FL=1